MLVLWLLEGRVLSREKLPTTFAAHHSGSCSDRQPCGGHADKINSAQSRQYMRKLMMSLAYAPYNQAS
jgi:hypothetical protein